MGRGYKAMVEEEHKRVQRVEDDHRYEAAEEGLYGGQRGG